MYNFIFDICIIFFLFFGNLFIDNHKYYFFLIYIFLTIYHIYIFSLFIQNYASNIFEIKYFIFTSFTLYIFSYYFICDPNPFFSFIFYYILYPDFIKAILIIFIHSYFLSISTKNNKNIILNLNAELSVKYELTKDLNIEKTYFLSKFVEFVKDKKLQRISCIILALFFLIDVFLFENRISLWVYFNKKNKTLPISFSKNKIFYITSNIINMENIIENYIEEMKKLIDYLGDKNIIISIVENGDSADNTRIYLEDFKNYLNGKKILNKFILRKEVEDIRKKVKPFIKSSRLRIEFYAKLRNKCFDYLYELSNIDFNNTIVIYFNDVMFRYEDIINLLSTNKEDFDSVCGLDMYSHYFYDRWVTIDLDGNGLKKYFPFFINKEAQDLILNHQPIRVFSCWNGIIAFKANSLRNKQLQFRYKRNYTIPKYLLNTANKNYYESECTYFNIDLFSLGYTKKFINPDVRVVYRSEDYFNAKYYIPSILHIAYSFILYFMGFFRKRNKLMSDYYNKEIKLNDILKKWYLENKDYN